MMIIMVLIISIRITITINITISTADTSPRRGAEVPQRCKQVVESGSAHEPACSCTVQYSTVYSIQYTV